MSAGAFEDDGDAVIEMDLLPPRWLDIQDEVTEYLADISKQNRRLEQLHQKHVLPGFDDEDVKKREEQEIEQLTQEITRGFQSCQKAIQRIEMMVREAKQLGNISKGEETMAKNLKISLASRAGEVSAMFRKKQSAYLKSMLFSYLCSHVCFPPVTDTNLQNSAPLEVSPHLFALQRLYRTPTTTQPSKSPMPTAPSRNPHSSKPLKNDSPMTQTPPSLRNANAKSKTLPKVLSNSPTYFKNYKQWSSTKVVCLIVLIITLSVWL